MDQFNEVMDEVHDISESIDPDRSSREELQRALARLREIYDYLGDNSLGASLGARQSARRSVSSLTDQIQDWLEDKSTTRAPGAHLIYR